MASCLKSLWIWRPRGLAQRTAGHPQTPTPRGALSRGLQPGLSACASLSLLRPPSPYFSSLSPPPVAAALARPRRFRPTGLPSPAHSFTARAGERRGPSQVGAPSRSSRVRAAPAVAAPGSMVGWPKNYLSLCNRAEEREVEVSVWECKLSAYASTWVTSVGMAECVRGLPIPRVLLVTMVSKVQRRMCKIWEAPGLRSGWVETKAFSDSRWQAPSSLHLRKRSSTPCRHQARHPKTGTQCCGAVWCPTLRSLDQCVAHFEILGRRNKGSVTLSGWSLMPRVWKRSWGRDGNGTSGEGIWEVALGKWALWEFLPGT